MDKENRLNTDEIRKSFAEAAQEFSDGCKRISDEIRRNMANFTKKMEERRNK